MEDIVKIQGYHTCKTDGGLDCVLSGAPFLSESNNRQWLTQGYYFWTDSDHFAHKWGTYSIKGSYAIVGCSIEIKKQLLLDLVGSVEDQLCFEKMINAYKDRLKKSDQNKKTTVNTVIAFYRKFAENNPAIFPYLAIKAQDKYSEFTIEFINSGTKPAYLPMVTRQQLCLFESAIDCIKSKNLVYPVQ